MPLIPDRVSKHNPKDSEQLIKNQTAKKSCLVCENFRACHPRTSLCYCTDGSKAVFLDAGCSSWKLDPKLKSINTARE